MIALAASVAVLAVALVVMAKLPQPARRPHFNTTEARNRPRAADTAGGMAQED